MPRLVPISRKDFVSRLRTLGFDGPFAGSDHDFMARDDLIVRVPNPHAGDISVDLLRRILRNAGISREEWLRS